MKVIEQFRHGDGAHCGLGDWYPDKEKALASAIKRGKPFDTGWYASKKEIASARVWSEDGTAIKVQVSVSDDFDTEGMGSATVTRNGKPVLESVRNAIYAAWEEAEQCQKDNREYQGYSLIHHSAKIPEWLRDRRETRKRHHKKVPHCLDYYIANRSDWIDSHPPGDNYSHWRWQSDPDCDSENAGCTCDPAFGVPKRTVKAFQQFAQSLKTGNLRIGDWEIKSWED